MIYTSTEQRNHKNQQLVNGYTELLKQQDVTHYFTLTFGKPISSVGARAKYSEWIDCLEWFQRRPLGWLRAEETKRWPGAHIDSHPAIPLHYHGVLIAAPNLNIPQSRALWHEMAGDADVQAFDPARGAISYCLKSAFDSCSTYELGGMKAFRHYTALRADPLFAPVDWHGRTQNNPK